MVRTKPKYITIEDLSVKSLLENNAPSELHKNIQDSMFRYFFTKLIEKAEYYDIEIRKADKFFASSKKCSMCGHKHKDLKLTDRVFTCPECGFTINRDLNAAINLCNLKKYTIINNFQSSIENNRGLRSLNEVVIYYYTIVTTENVFEYIITFFLPNVFH